MKKFLITSSFIFLFGMQNLFAACCWLKDGSVCCVGSCPCYKKIDFESNQDKKLSIKKNDQQRFLEYLIQINKEKNKNC
jgi:hypothetical protein